MSIWPHTYLNINGEPVKAQAPLIVSASRSTDIPAFYADWFFHRLEKGYSVWINPFNGARSYVSFENTRFIVFWSKNPRPLLQHLHKLEARNIRCYIQYTLNDYEAESLERVPPLDERIDTFRKLVDRLGMGSVIWRFDPLILTDRISIPDLLEKVQRIGDRLKGYTGKLVFSYADITPYRKVRANLERHGIRYQEWTSEQMRLFAAHLSAMNRDRGWEYRLATCGESLDLSSYGVEPNRCIDGELIARLLGNDGRSCDDFRLVGGDGVRSCGDFRLAGGNGSASGKDQVLRLPEDSFGRMYTYLYRKDPGQRAACGCCTSKDIGQYNTCPHLCAYCYANTSRESVLSNWELHRKDPYAETITGR